MDKDLSDSDCQTSQDNENEQSLVNKLKKNVTEIISNTPLSKWFRNKQTDTPTSTIRRRQDDSDDESDFHEFQPPAKRSRLPPNKEALSLDVSETLSPISSINHVKKPLYNNFPEPMPGPSGYQTRKMLNSTSFMPESNFKSAKTFAESRGSVFKNPRILNSTSENNVNNKESQSDSEESTSGYSSGRIGSKEIVSQESSKQTSPLENSPRKARSLFQSTSSSHTLFDSSVSPNRNSSMSSRMPSFNPSTFGSSSFVDRTLATKRILNSPFYNGNTIYGGASAYGRNSKRVPQDMRKVLRQSVSIKPVNKPIEKGGDLQLGKTARRILDTLEQYSSPISDAKKIPVTSSKRFRSEGSLTKYIGANPYTLREPRNASNKELQVPSVTDLLKMKMDQQKTRLQDSTEAVRQIAAKSKSVLNEEGYQIPIQSESDRYTGKMKAKITSLRPKLLSNEAVPELKLNPVSLPIKELPKFDIIVPPPSQTPLTTSNTSNIFNNQTKPSLPANKPVVPTVTYSTPVEKGNDITKQKENLNIVSPSTEDTMEFKFSAPLILAEYLKPLKALNNFKFSEPLVKKRRSIHPELDNQESKTDSAKSKKNNGEKLSSLGGDVQVGGTSLMDMFKPKEGTWECSVCMIRNQADKEKCAACETPRKSSSQNVTKASNDLDKTAKPACSSNAFGDKFKAASNTWECPTCMIRNEDSIQKCAACETKKPGISVPPVFSGSFRGPLQTQVYPPNLPHSWGDKFKASSDTWECPTCMIRNQSDVPKCAACETQKPGNASSKTTSFPASGGSSFGTKFAPPSSTWECPVCLIRNKDELLKCAACESAKPGATGQTGSFGGDFKKKDDEWECQVCMVRNKSSLAKCQCCESVKPGASLSGTTESSKMSSFTFGIDNNTASSFTFGVPPSAQSSANTPKTNAGLVFGEKRETSEQKGASSSFTFGIPPSTSSETKVKETKKDTPTAPTAAAPKTSEKESSKPVPTFTFAAPSKSEAVAEATKSAPTFKFEATSKPEDKGLSKPIPTFTFGAPKNDKPDEGGEKSEVKKVNPLLKPSEKLPEKAAVAGSGFSFGLSKGTSPVVSSTTSAKPNENSRTDGSPSKRSKPTGETETPKVPMFTFKPPTTNGDLNKAAPFSKSSEGNKASTGGFSFNAGAAQSSTPTNAVVAPSFGTTVSNPDSSKSAPVFKFGSSSSEAPKQANGFNFGSSSFGAKEPAANSTGVKPFSFASPALSAATVPDSSVKNPPPAFGVTPNKPPAVFQFGGTPENKPQTSAPTFSFNTPTNATTDKAPPPFSFGASAPAKAPAFGFGQSSASTSSFNFGSSNTKPEPAFGAGTATAGPFGAPSTKPDAAFGAALSQSSVPNGMFNFGSGTTTNQKAGFSFGASSGSSGAAGAAAPQTGFSFGSSTAAAPTASGGFNFSASAPSFDANAKPSFNFTGGAALTAFSAPPQDGGAVPQRKIKKAIRRAIR